MYRAPAGRLDRLHNALVSAVRRDWLPQAREIGTASARPVLDAMRGVPMAKKGRPLRGKALQRFGAYSRKNSRALYAALDKEFDTLSGDIRAAFFRADRDGVARKKLIDALVGADRGELARIEAVRAEISKRGTQLQRAERRLARASPKQQARARRALKRAQQLRKKAKGKIRTAKTFYARFETAVQGEVRDSIRRECQKAQFESFRQEVGDNATFSWVTVNGVDACPSCDDRHGVTQSAADWRGDGPGEGGTYCGDACMCQLVPESYAASNQGLKEPVKVGPPSDKFRPTKPPAAVPSRAVVEPLAPTRPRPSAFIPARSTREAVERLSRHTRPSEARGIQGVHYEGAKLDQLNSVLRATEDSLGRHNVKVTRLGWRSHKKRDYGLCRIYRKPGGEISVTNVEIRKTVAMNPGKYALRDAARFEANLASQQASQQRFLATLRQGVQKGTVRGNVGGQIADIKAKLTRMRHTKRFTVLADADDFTYALQQHECWHAVYHHKAAENAFAAALKERGVTRMDWYKVSEWAGSSESELFAETGAAIHSGIAVPVKIEQAFRQALRMAP